MKSKSKLQLSDACDAKAVLSKIEGPAGTAKVVAVLIGVAMDYTEQNNPQDDTRPIIGFTGQFEIIPTEGETIRSAKLFLPVAFHDTLDKSLKAVLFPKADKPDFKARGASVRFGAQVAVVKADGGAGYQWGLKFEDGPAPADPLADLRSRMVKAAPAGETAPKAAPAGETAPKAAETAKDAPPAKGKGK